MMTIYFICLGIAVYVYILYPILLSLFSKKKNLINDNASIKKNSYSIIIPAFNEFAHIEQKIVNCFALTKNHSVQIILNSAGSNDGTQKLNFENVLHLTSIERKGKAHAMNEAARLSIGEILIFTDANTNLTENLLEELNQSFLDPKVGIVLGKKTIQTAKNNDLGEYSYWQLENRLKKLESSFHSVTTSPGEMLAIRKSLFEPIPEAIILDDFYLSTNLAKKGFLIQMNEHIVASEKASTSLYDEYIRRTRIASGVLQWLHLYGRKMMLSFPFTYLWQFLSNKVGRWLIAPIAFVGILLLGFLSNIQILFIFNISILLFIGIGALMNQLKLYYKLFQIPFYFFFIHICMAVGYWQYIVGKSTVLWKKVNRG